MRAINRFKGYILQEAVIAICLLAGAGIFFLKNVAHQHMATAMAHQNIVLSRIAQTVSKQIQSNHFLCSDSACSNSTSLGIPSDLQLKGSPSDTLIQGPLGQPLPVQRVIWTLSSSNFSYEFVTYQGK